MNRITFMADSREAYKIVEMINAQRRKRKLAPLTEEQIRNNSITETRNLPSEGISIIYRGALLQQALAKIIYELAYYWLGDDYLRDPLAEVLRQFLRDETIPDDWETRYIFRGLARPVGEGNTPFRSDYPDHHYAELFGHDAGLMCYVRVFSLWEALILVTSTPETYPDARYHQLLINPKTGATELM